jgi:hypothetical protein
LPERNRCERSRRNRNKRDRKRSERNRRGEEQKGRGVGGTGIKGIEREVRGTETFQNFRKLEHIYIHIHKYVIDDKPNKVHKGWK